MLVTWIREVADEPLLLNGDEAAEARENTWSFGLADGERPSTAVVVAAFEDTAGRQGDRVAALGRTATFYVWHDVQAGQLRCSTTSSPRDRLPFGATLDLTVPLAAVVERFLHDPGGFIAWDDLDESDDDAPEFVLGVWAVEIGLSSSRTGSAAPSSTPATHPR